MKYVALVASLIAVPVSPVVQTEDPSRCVTTAEADALIALQLPDILKLGVTCRRLLPRDAFLQSDTAVLQARLRSEMTDTSSLADRGARRLAGEPTSEPIFGLARALFGSTPGFRLLGSPNVQGCRALDRAFSSTASAPAATVASAVRVASDLHGDDEQAERFPICAEPRP